MSTDMWELVTGLCEQGSIKQKLPIGKILKHLYDYQRFTAVNVDFFSRNMTKTTY